MLLKSISASRFRVGEFDFTRGGDLSPELLVVFLVYMTADGNRRGIRHLLADFWTDAEELGLELPRPTAVSAPAVCRARQRLDPSVFRDVLRVLAGACPEGVEAKGEATWHGRRVYAVDGQKVNLRRSDDLSRHFGTPKHANNPQALYSVLVDVCARMPVDFQLSSYRASERDHLASMLDSLEAGDLLILDRGYPSHAVLQDLTARGIDFLIRVPASESFAAIDAFRDSGQVDEEVTLKLRRGAPKEWEALDVRLVRNDGAQGPAFYFTSLKEDEASRADIAGLYKQRWDVEEYFKAFASEYVGQRQFRSKMPSGIEQEFGALTLLYAMSRIVAAKANEQIEHDGCKVADRAYVSQKAAVLGMGVLFMKVALSPAAPDALKFIDRAMRRLLLTLDKPRPDRSFPRRSFRPRPKWGPSGHRGH